MLHEGRRGGVEGCSDWRAGGAGGDELVANGLGEDLPELDAPLVERVDAPDEALDRNPVLVERQQTAQLKRCVRRDQQTQARAVASEHHVGLQGGRDALRGALALGLAHGEGVWLREEVGHEFVVARDFFSRQLHRVLRLAHSDELGRDHAPLVHQLVEAAGTQRGGNARNGVAKRA